MSNISLLEVHDETTFEMEFLAFYSGNKTHHNEGLDSNSIHKVLFRQNI